ncbi:hypothetical protein [Natrinema soli]|uniref:Uncharacterized protein n=1 Tax=Natrinema soli TaxID=1930624 RepID=A0ABD5SLK0_9EURY|nr:hypothetical protein [Natrinema soli]
MDELEDRLGLPEDHFDADVGIVCWVQDLNGDWHASMYFEGTRHAAACGECFETPVADVRDDPRRLADTHICDDCKVDLEADDDETAPDGGEFAPASELRADGGEVDVYQWVLENVREFPAGIDSRWGSCGNLVHQGRKLDSVEKDDVQAAIARAVDNEDLLSWHGLLARAEIDRLREIVHVEHEEHGITRQILVGKCNKLIAAKKQEQAGEAESEPEVATDGGVDQSSDGTGQVEFHSTFTSSATKMTRFPRKSRASATKIRASPCPTRSVSIRPIVHPISKPARTVAVRPKPTRRRSLPTMSLFCDLRGISTQPEVASLYFVRRSDLVSERRSLQLGGDQL